MKTLVAGLVVAAALLVPQASAVDDLGEPDLLVSACAEVGQMAEAQGIAFTACRRAAPDELRSPNTAVMHVALIRKGSGPLKIQVLMHKGLWSTSAAFVEN